MERDTKLYHHLIWIVWVGIIRKPQATSKVVRLSTFIPEKHALLKVYKKAFVGTPYFNCFWRCIFEYSFGVTPSESHYAIPYQKEYKKNLQG